MTSLWAWVAVLAAAAAACVLWPRRPRPHAADGDATNVALYRARLAEIDDEAARGLVDAEAARQMRDEVGATLLAEATAAAARAPAAAAPASAAAGRSRLGIALAVLVPLAALGWYARFGAWQALETADVAAAVAAASASAGGGHGGDVTALMLKLEARLQQTPDDADGWFLLGRTALENDDVVRAARAFERVVELVPDALAAGAYLAQARFMRDGNRVTPAVREAIDRVLAKMPDQPIMMELLAVDAFARGAYAETEGYLSRALAGGAEPERAPFLEAGIARARELQGLPPAPSGRSIVASVGVAPGTTLPAGGTVFVVARGSASPMPLAVVRRDAAELPFSVTLDRSAAMSPALTLDGVTDVEVSARYSPRGSAERGDGDVESPRVPVRLGDEPAAVRLVLGAPAAEGHAAATAPTVPAAAPAAAPAGIGPGTGDAAPAVEGGATGGQPAAGDGLRVLVELAPGLEADAGATVFVFARERGGPPMPLAVTRVAVSSLPVLVALTDAMAMTPARTLSSVRGAVDVVARVSRSGSATAASGDLEGSAPASGDGSVVRVRIDRRIP
jgi:cytochrome c-type biogenesis protein CcmH